ncbi:hypothetical protein O181_104932, partial [Austropuccinia psidii MF-1]|nr:hypothetical protein [Austropuccinia psidii MF-1]
NSSSYLFSQISPNHPFPPPSFSPNHLIILPGHAIYLGDQSNHQNLFNSSNWVLEPYQEINSNNSIATFLNHIQIANQLAQNDQNSLLIYSGGQTRSKSNQLTEATSYLRLAQQLNLHLLLNHKSLQMTTEDYALDSWTNLIYSIARFNEYTGQYPQKITIVGHAVKASRFINIHRKALRWPKEKFNYIGLDPIIHSKSSNKINLLHQSNQISQGEKKVYLNFEIDLYGCHGELLEKRKNRNPFRRFHPYRDSCPEIKGLLDWCPINGIDPYPAQLPWSNLI